MEPCRASSVVVRLVVNKSRLCIGFRIGDLGMRMVVESVAKWTRTAVNVSVGRNYLITKLYRNNICVGVLMGHFLACHCRR